MSTLVFILDGLVCTCPPSSDYQSFEFLYFSPTQVLHVFHHVGLDCFSWVVSSFPDSTSLGVSFPLSCLLRCSTFSSTDSMFPSPLTIPSIISMVGDAFCLLGWSDFFFSTVNKTWGIRPWFQPDICKSTYASLGSWSNLNRGSCSSACLSKRVFLFTTIRYFL